jgi:hypothetical protein
MFARLPFHFSVVTITFFPFPQPTFASNKEPQKKTNPANVVLYARGLSNKQFYPFVDKLGKKKRFKQLEAIFRARFPHSDYAATVYAREVDADKVIGFCSKFPLDSSNWYGAFWGLKSRPKNKVIGYIKQIATSSDPMVRIMCYKVCSDAGWGDLLKNAKNDRKSNFPAIGPGNRLGDTLGKIATRYIKQFKSKGKKKRINGDKWCQFFFLLLRSKNSTNTFYSTGICGGWPPSTPWATSTRKATTPTATLPSPRTPWVTTPATGKRERHCLTRGGMNLPFASCELPVTMVP